MTHTPTHTKCVYTSVYKLPSIMIASSPTVLGNPHIATPHLLPHYVLPLINTLPIQPHSCILQ